MSNREFSVKNATWINNTPIKPHPEDRFINSSWKLNIQTKLQLFAWKLIRDIFSTKTNLYDSYRMNVNADCTL